MFAILYMLYNVLESVGLPVKNGHLTKRNLQTQCNSLLKSQNNSLQNLKEQCSTLYGTK